MKNNQNNVNYRIFFKICLILVLLSLSGCGMGAEKTIEQCASIYHTALNDSTLQSPAKLAGFLEKNSTGCIQFDEYNVWLGAAYLEAGEYQKSAEVAKKALPAAKEYKPNLLQIIAEAELQTGSIDEAFKQAEQIAKDYPKYAPILGMLSEISVKRGDWNAALDYGRKSYAIEKSLPSMLMMIGPLSQLNQDEEVVKIFHEMLKLDPTRIAKTNGLLEAIFSLVALNRRDEAAQLAKLHMEANPDWRSNPTFARAAYELKVTEEYTPLPKQ